MNNDTLEYGRLCGLCDEELAAADEADSKDALIKHLEQAFRFAQEASKERGGSPDCDRTL
jgi:hypothetical protein